MQGNNYIMNASGSTRIEHHWINTDSFETADGKILQERLMVRVLNKNEEYWVFHKNLVDDS
jgi:hypothetical protein